MKNLIVFICGILLIAFLFSGFANATEEKETSDYYKELMQVCEQDPEECTDDGNGAGNGGGNEPPYTPRKPPKKEK